MTNSLLLQRRLNQYAINRRQFVCHIAAATVMAACPVACNATSTIEEDSDIGIDLFGEGSISIRLLGSRDIAVWSADSTQGIIHAHLYGSVDHGMMSEIRTILAESRFSRVLDIPAPKNTDIDRDTEHFQPTIRAFIRTREETKRWLVAGGDHLFEFYQALETIRLKALHFAKPDDNHSLAVYAEDLHFPAAPEGVPLVEFWKENGAQFMPLEKTSFRQHSAIRRAITYPEWPVLCAADAISSFPENGLFVAHESQRLRVFCRNLES